MVKLFGSLVSAKKQFKRKYYTEDWHSDWDIWDISYQQSIE